VPNILKTSPGRRRSRLLPAHSLNPPIHRDRPIPTPAVGITSRGRRRLRLQLALTAKPLSTTNDFVSLSHTELRRLHQTDPLTIQTNSGEAKSIFSSGKTLHLPRLGVLAGATHCDNNPLRATQTSALRTSAFKGTLVREER